MAENSKNPEDLDRTKIEFMEPYMHPSNPMDDMGIPKGNDNILKNLMHSKGVYFDSDMDMYDSFYRYQRMDPHNYPRAAREYVFFTKPDLYIFKAGSLSSTSDNAITSRFLTKGQLQPALNNNAFFRGLVERGYAKLLSELQFSINPSKPFINILSNRKSSNLDLTAINADSFETSRNYYGTKLDYRRSSEPSDEGVEFAVEFEDTKYLEIYNFFRAYDEYEKLKWYGKVNPPKQEYIWYKVLHDQFGVYKFVVDDTNETILHWSQFWGVYPTNVPRDTFSNVAQEGNIKFTINFKAQFVEDMNPVTINDFNNLCRLIPSSGESPTWDDKLAHVNGENVVAPYIKPVQGVYNLNTDNEKKVVKFAEYKLLWRDRGEYDNEQRSL